MTTICSDKTGTLTLNELIVRSIVTSGGVYDTTGSGYDPHGGFLRNGKDVVVREDIHLTAALRPLALCNDAVLRETDGAWSVEGDPTEGALLAAAVKGGVNLEKLALELPRTDEIPFELQHRFMATLHHDHDGAGYIFVKGAPERLLEMCFWEQGVRGEQRPLDCACWLDRIIEMATRGQRVLAVASKKAEEGQQQLAFGDVESGLVFVGLIGLIDPPRPEAVEAIRACATAGMSVKMITGDHAATAIAIARELGLNRPDSVLTGRDLDAIGDEELGEAACATTVFARTSPEHKLRLVQALQKRGEVVAMTGDGVNDAPALKRADIGIAMGVKGTEAAKEAAEMVLADDNFASIVHAVHEGRVVYENLKKTILYILPTNGGEGLTVIAAIAMGETLPVTPVQILWINLITAVTLGLALAFEPPTKGVMLRPPRPSGEPILSRYFVWRIVFVSLLMLIATFGLYELEKARDMGLDSARTVAVNTLVACEVAYLFNARFLSESSLSLKGLFGSRAVLISVAIVVVLQAHVHLRALYAGAVQHHAARPGDMVAYRRRERRAVSARRGREGHFPFARDGSRASWRSGGAGDRRSRCRRAWRLGPTCRRRFIGAAHHCRERRVLSSHARQSHARRSVSWSNGRRQRRDRPGRADADQCACGRRRRDAVVRPRRASGEGRDMRDARAVFLRRGSGARAKRCWRPLSGNWRSARARRRGRRRTSKDWRRVRASRRQPQGAGRGATRSGAARRRKSNAPKRKSLCAGRR